MSELNVLDTLMKHNDIDLKTRELTLSNLRDTTMAKEQVCDKGKKQFHHILSHTRPYIHHKFLTN